MATAAEIIARKRDGQTLAPDDIRTFMRGFATGQIADYQMAALAMAVYLRGMDDEETAVLTQCMTESGQSLEWSGGGKPLVDKHSTGGIGDKVSLILAPLLACCDVRVPMISGRGLGPTGGTLDKLEAIPGFRTNLDRAEMMQVVDRIGCVITGATPEIAPADRKLYALRDVTATVASIPLITASILSKKLAEGLDVLVLDVKHGSGAFMKSIESARQLASSLVNTASRLGLESTAILSDMNQPLGRCAGNAIEVDESLEVLRGGGPADLIELTLELGTAALVLSGKATEAPAARKQLQACLADGRALERFEQLVALQGGDLSAPRPLAPATEIAADQAGYVTSIDTEQLGWAIIQLGGGRQRAGDVIDPSVGIEMLVRLGDPVEDAQPIVRLFAHPPTRAAAIHRIRQAIHIAPDPIPSDE